LTAEIVADAEAAARRGAELIAEAITEPGALTLAVSGGHAPWRMFELLGARDLDWSQVTMFQVDERIAPDGDPDRNLTHLRESLPPEALERVRPMPVTDPDPDTAAERYAAELPKTLDLVHLGPGGARSPGRDHRRVPGPTPHDPHLSGSRGRAQDPLADHRCRQGRRPVEATGRRRVDPRRPHSQSELDVDRRAGGPVRRSEAS
jgi:hypothetical protein